MATNPPQGGLPPSIHISFKHVAIVLIAAAVVVGIARFAFMHTVDADVGEEVVFIDKPYFWGKSGVRDTPLTTGRKTEFNSTTEVSISVLPIAYAIRLTNVPTKNNIPINVEAIAILRITNSPDIISKFGHTWYENAVLPKYMSLARDPFGHRLAADLIGDSDTVKNAELEFADNVRQMLVEDGIAVELVDLSIINVTLLEQPKPLLPTKMGIPKLDAPTQTSQK